jgi:hypothetical protein
LREARISLWSVREWPDPDTYLAYLDFLAPLKPGDTVKPGHLALPVLAIQSGGSLLETSGGDVEEAIRKCIEKESVSYTLTFDPPLTDQVDDYHDLKVVVRKPDLISLTNTGYYNQPVYHDHPSEAKRLTVEQLEQMLEAAHASGDKELARELFGVELTERMSSTKLSSWKARQPGEKVPGGTGCAGRQVGLLFSSDGRHSSHCDSGSGRTTADARAHHRLFE